MSQKRIRCIVSAGPTREHFDPVRFISNPSSGKMGYALAIAARDIGWEVRLVSGPVQISPPENVDVMNVVSGDEMYEAIASNFYQCDVLIMCAAPSDYRPKESSLTKVKKEALSMTVEMEATVDILKTLGAKKKGQFLVGFAAETNDILRYATDKLKRKNCDCIVANQVGGAASAFGSDRNAVSLIFADGTIFDLGPDLKSNIAKSLIEKISKAIEQ